MTFATDLCDFSTSKVPLLDVWRSGSGLLGCGFLASGNGKTLLHVFQNDRKLLLAGEDFGGLAPCT